jgi:hypothetical protein
MVDLGKLQHKLNSDENYRKEFMANPAEHLRKEGLTLSPEMEKSLRNLVEASKSPKSPVAGSSVGPQADDGIVISISKNF